MQLYICRAVLFTRMRTAQFLTASARFGARTIAVPVLPQRLVSGPSRAFASVSGPTASRFTGEEHKTKSVESSTGQSSSSSGRNDGDSGESPSTEDGDDRSLWWTGLTVLTAVLVVGTYAYDFVGGYVASRSNDYRAAAQQACREGVLVALRDPQIYSIVSSAVRSFSAETRAAGQAVAEPASGGPSAATGLAREPDAVAQLGSGYTERGFIKVLLDPRAVRGLDTDTPVLSSRVVLHFPLGSRAGELRVLMHGVQTAKRTFRLTGVDATVCGFDGSELPEVDDDTDGANAPASASSSCMQRMALPLPPVSRSDVTVSPLSWWERLLLGKALRWVGPQLGGQFRLRVGEMLGGRTVS